MMHWLREPLKEFEPLGKVYNYDQELINNSLFSGVGICLFFLIIGATFWFMAKKGPNSTRLKSTLSRMIAIAFVMCAIARGFEVMALWHNYAYLIAMFKDLTCLFAGIAAAFLPNTLKQVIEQRTLEDVHKAMQETAAKLDEVKQINAELNIAK